MSSILKFICLLALWFPSWAVAADTQPLLAQRGELPMPEQELEGSVRLEGTWRMMWKQFIPVDSLDQVGRWEKVSFLTSWDKLADPLLRDRSQGFATYHLSLFLPGQRPREVGLLMPEFHTAYTLLLNGDTLVQNGRPARIASKSRPAKRRRLVELELRPGDNDLVLYASNFEYYRGGAQSPIYMGPISALQAQQNSINSTALFLSGALLVIAISALILYYFQQRQRYFLMISLFSLLFIYRLLGADTDLLAQLYPGVSWQWALRLEYASLALAVPTLAWAYRWMIRPVGSRRWFQALTGISLLMLLSLLLPTSTFSALYPFYLLATLVLSLVIVGIYLSRFRPSHTLAWVVALALLGIGGGSLLRVSTFFNLFSGTILASFGGYGLFVVAQAIALSQRFGYNLRQEIQRTEAAKVSQRYFLNSVSHELRTPMNAILGQSQVLADSGLSKEQSKKLEVLKKNSEELNRLLLDLLNFSALDSGKLKLNTQKFDLRAQIESTAQEVENQFIKKKLSFTMKLDPNIPNTLVGDPEKVELIIRHLLHNAFKFTKTGEVKLAVKVAERDNNKVGFYFQISDTGPGMSKKEVDRLTEAFTQGDEGNTRQHGGTGLGLNLSTRLAELMGGELFLDSKPGKGTAATFTLTLPVPRMNLSRETEYLREDHQQLDPALKILYAEDNPVNQKLLTMMLKNMGYEVDLAQDGKEAVKMAAKKTYHIIFMDVQMPEMDGIEATRQIIKEEQHRPIIIAVTANADVADQKRCLEAGMNDFIAKPFNAKSLKEGLIKWQGLRRYLDGDNEQGVFQNIS